MPLICDSYSTMFTWYFNKGKLLIPGAEFEWGQTIVEKSTCVDTPRLFLYHREIYLYEFFSLTNFGFCSFRCKVLVLLCIRLGCLRFLLLPENFCIF